MKNIYQSVGLFLAGMAFASCGNDWLDTQPSDASPADKAISDYQSAEVALNGVYDGLQGSSDRVSYYGARMFYYGDVRGEDMQARVQGMRSSSCYEMKYAVDDAPDMWSVPYNVIRRANRLLEAVDLHKVADATEEELSALKAEALTIRALAHFDLCRIYARPYGMDGGTSLGVPIVTVPLEMDALPGRNTVAEVYGQVLKDLQEALDSGGLSDKKRYGYVNRWFAEALMARVCLYKEENDKALQWAEQVINDSPYELWTNEEYAEGWKTSGEGRKEMIFEIVNKSTDDWTDREGISYLMNEDGYADLIATKEFLDLMAGDSMDVRNGILIPAATDKDLKAKYGESPIFVNKFPVEEGKDFRLNSVPLMRLSEVYLIAAEAAAKTGQSDKAARYLNKIVQRANPEAAALSAAEATVERILLENRKEFVGEGHRFFDAMRNGQTVTRYEDENNKGWHYSLVPESRKFDRTYFRTILPIPSDEINVNPKLKEQQNEGY